jgi:hypothetical protein
MRVTRLSLVAIHDNGCGGNRCLGVASEHIERGRRSAVGGRRVAECAPMPVSRLVASSEPRRDWLLHRYLKKTKSKSTFVVDHRLT